MRFRREVLPFLLASIIVSLLVAIILKLFAITLTIIIPICLVLLVIVGGYMLFFFRDPKRKINATATDILAAADGTVAKIKEMQCEEFFGTEEVIRVSIFLSLFSVHVNRAPIAGTIKFLQYYPGKRFFTFQEKSSDFNQHNSIMIQGTTIKCLVNQIVGPVCRRVVNWLKLEQQVAVGERIGMMKFGSRLDMFFPKKDVEITVKVGTKVNAGLSVIGTIKK